LLIVLNIYSLLSPMDKLELRGPKDLLAKRKKVFSTLNLEEVAALKASENAEQVAQDFDRIFLKLLRLIKYSTAKNKAEKSEIETQTNNLIKKLLNYLRKKPLENKMRYEQKAFFQDICSFINFFVDDTYLSEVHNSIPKTSLEDYSKQSVWNQLFQNMYARNRWVDWISQGWSCSYWTILLYNFFNKLKEAWLDLKIKLFRFKNLDDYILWQFPSQRHSWLIINFQWEDYMIDHDGIIYDREKSIARPLTPYIDMPATNNNPKDVHFFENFRHSNMQENDKVKFFDNIDEFIQHCVQYPEHYKLSFYVKFPEKEKTEKVTYEFWKYNFWLWIDWTMHEFYLKDNALQPNNFLKNLIKKSFIKRVGDNFIPITQEDTEMLKKYFSLAKSKLNTDLLYKNYTSWNTRETELVEWNWKARIALMEK